MRTRQKCVATDTWRSLGCRTTPLEHWSRRKPTVDLQTELETTGDEVKTNTAERIRIAESISSVKRDLDILSEQLASKTVGRTLAAELRAAKSK